jgi:hypothetical protein
MPQEAAMAGQRVISGRTMRQPPAEVKGLGKCGLAMRFQAFRQGRHPAIALSP